MQWLILSTTVGMFMHAHFHKRHFMMHNRIIDGLRAVHLQLQSLPTAERVSISIYPH